MSDIVCHSPAKTANPKGSVMKKLGSQKESGYALLSLLVAMTIGLVLLASTASKPSTQFVTQRENEQEAFFRANQVAYAIQTYAAIRGGISPQNLPTKLEDLTQKFNVQGREFYIVRKSAMVDPLTGKEWKPVRLGDPKIREFARTYMRVLAEEQALAMASGGGAQSMAAAQSQQGMPPLLTLAAQAGGLNIANLNSDEEKEGEESKPSTASGFSLDLDNDSRPIVGIMSSLKKPMIRNYYTIENYDKAIFIAGVAMPGMNFAIPLGGGMGGVGGAGGGGQGQDEQPGQQPQLKKNCPPGSNSRFCQ